MSVALYRKYRPGSFGEVLGQEHVTEPLRQALRSGRINHAYLFSGPRGCGKTTSARILARSLNCAGGPTPDPCGTCDSCVALAPDGAGSVDVIEIDAASHGGVDDARELRERAFFAPVSSRYKVYIVDEAHMVTREGFNALLKLVEEPPAHLKFIFATTEPDKVISTIRSRTHHYPFRLIAPSTLRQLMEEILATEGVAYDPAALPLVVRAGAGSARDSLSVLDQLLAGSDERGITREGAIGLLGYTDSSLLAEMVQALGSQDGAAVFELIDRVVEAGNDPRRFTADLLERMRDLLVLTAVPDALDKGLINVSPDATDQMAAQARDIGHSVLTHAANTLSEGLTQMRGATSPRLQLELICARILYPAVSVAAPAAPSAAAPAARPGPAQSSGQHAAHSPAHSPAQHAAQSQAHSPAQHPAQSTAQGTAQGAPPAARATQPSSPAQSPAQAPAQSPAQSPAQASAQPASTAQRPDQPAAPTHGGPAESVAAPSAPASAPPSAPSAVPPPPAAGGDAQGQAVLNAWPRIMEAVKSRRRFTWMILAGEGVGVLGVDGKTLRIGFPRSNDAKGFSRSGSDQILQAAVNDVLGVELHVVAEESQAGSVPAGPAPTSAPQNPPPSSGAPHQQARSAPAPQHGPPNGQPGSQPGGQHSGQQGQPGGPGGDSRSRDAQASATAPPPSDDEAPLPSEPMPGGYDIDPDPRGAQSPTPGGGPSHAGPNAGSANRGAASPANTGPVSSGAPAGGTPGFTTPQAHTAGNGGSGGPYSPDSAADATPIVEPVTLIQNELRGRLLEEIDHRQDTAT